MFELGMRLAFDKPVVIIKDDETNYTFDIGLIQHMEYPKSLNFHTIERFIKDLSSKILNTYNSYISDPHSNSFLRHFGEFEIQKLNPKSLDEKELMNMMNSNFEGLQRDIRRLSGRINILSHNTSTKFSEIEDYLSSGRQHASQINFDDKVPF